MADPACLPDKCLWSQSSSFCTSLRNANVPLDDKWPVLILYLRGIGNNPLLSQVQKNALQQVMLRLLHHRNYTNETYLATMRQVHSILNSKCEQKLQEIAREAEALAKEVATLLGRQKEHVKTVSEQVEHDIALGLDPKKILTGVRSSLKDLIAKIEHDTLALTKLSHKDSLTGLANRRALEVFLEESVAMWKKNNTPVAAIMLDVDNFKRCNDTYGHSVGDLVLQAISKRLDKVVTMVEGSNTSALAARYGGEEFLLIIRGSQAEAASFVAEQIRLLIEATPVNANLGIKGENTPPVAVTVSLGISHLWHGWKNSFEANLLDAADKALYVAKQQGRNRTVAFVPESSTFLPVEPAGLVVYED